MNLKKIKIISCFGVFLMCTLCHFLYDWFPNTIFSIFFSVNESIFEHMKMLFSATLLYGIIEFILLVKCDIKHNNYLFNLLISGLCNIAIFLIIYLPVYYVFGEIMIFTLIWLFISICITEFISFNLLQLENIKNSNIFSLIGIIIIYIIIGYLTYYPPKLDFFFDPEEKKYGISYYILK